MHVRRTVLALLATAAVACSGSDAPSLVTDTTVPDLSDGELVDGAFEPNDGDARPGDEPTESVRADDAAPPASDQAATTLEADASSGESSSSDTGSSTSDDANTDPSTVASESDDGTTGSDASAGTGDGGSAATTSTGGGTTGSEPTASAPTNAPATNRPATSTPAATTPRTSTPSSAPSTTPAGTTPTPTSSAPSNGNVQPGTGLVTIGGLTIPFVTNDCDIGDVAVSIRGASDTAQGQFIVRINTTSFDIDGDGEIDSTIELNVETDPDTVADDVDAPDYYVVGASSSTITADVVMDFSVDGGRIVASGPIEDLNRVAIPAGDTEPMTLDVRCP